MSPRPRIGVSRCLLGDAVRYDGGHRHAPSVLALATDFELVPVCPEVGAGMTTPRPPIQLVWVEGRVRVRGVEHPELDMTQALERFSRALVGRLRDVSGFVLKRGSPSCGVHDVPIHAMRVAGGPTSLGSGVLPRILASLRPGLPLIEDEALAQPAERARFLERVRAYVG